MFSQCVNLSVSTHLPNSSSFRLEKCPFLCCIIAMIFDQCSWCRKKHFWRTAKTRPEFGPKCQVIRYQSVWVLHCIVHVDKLGGGWTMSFGPVHVRLFRSWRMAKKHEVFRPRGGLFETASMLLSLWWTECSGLDAHSSFVVAVLGDERNTQAKSRWQPGNERKFSWRHRHTSYVHAKSERVALFRLDFPVSAADQHPRSGSAGSGWECWLSCAVSR